VCFFAIVMLDFITFIFLSDTESNMVVIDDKDALLEFLELVTVIRDTHTIGL